MSILKFVDGLDLSNNILDAPLPFESEDLGSLKWVKLNNSQVAGFPVVLLGLTNLESVTINGNALTTLPEELTQLTQLHTLSVRKNKLTTRGIHDLDIPALSVLDLSRNNLDTLPNDVLTLTCLVALSLAHNNLKLVDGELFVDKEELRFLDLSWNKLESLPPQMRRMARLQHLSLAGNPLQHANMRPVCALSILNFLNLSHTDRNNTNIPSEISTLSNLLELNLSHNKLTSIPTGVLSLERLRRLNLEHNEIAFFEVPLGGRTWHNLHSLNLSGNHLTNLPESMQELVHLRRLGVNSNRLTEKGIPEALGNLTKLTMLSMSNNHLSTIPPQLCACSQLRRLHLDYNNLQTLPPDIYLLFELEVLSVNGNPNLVMPVRPKQIDIAAQFYYVDFSRAAHMREEEVDEEKQWEQRDIHVNAQKMSRARHSGPKVQGDGSILKGLRQQTQSTQDMETYSQEHHLKQDIKKLEFKPRDWKEKLEKPPLSYSDLFDDTVGTQPGVNCWGIVNFKPVPSDETLDGQFFDGDTYIILHTFEKAEGGYDHQVYFWVGRKAPVDKKACGAMHAVHLRNHLGAQSVIRREEQGDESSEFLAILPQTIAHTKGHGTESSFFALSPTTYSTRLYCLTAGNRQNVTCDLCAQHWSSLTQQGVYMLDTGLTIYLWCGSKSNAVMQNKARLFAEQVNMCDRKKRATVVEVKEGDEPTEFWNVLEGPPNGPILETQPIDPTAQRHVTKLYSVEVVSGYVQLVQVEAQDGQLSPSLLKDHMVCILDCYSELFVWQGRTSSKLLRAAATRMIDVVLDVGPRPDHSKASRVLQYSEPMVFKSNFTHWPHGEISYFTAGAGAVPRNLIQGTGVDKKKKKWAPPKLQMTVDIQALYRRPRLLRTDEESMAIMRDYNYDLESMEVFHVSNRGLVRLKEHEVGVFHSAECYVILCVYWKESEKVTQQGEGEESKQEDQQEDVECVLYFWQGRDAPSTKWAQFALSTQQEMEDIIKRKYKCDVAVVRTFQQRESERLLCHFRRKCLVHKGKRETEPSFHTRLYQIRATVDMTTLRTVEVPAEASSLNSNFCSIAIVPYTGEGSVPDIPGMVYVWVGRYVPPSDMQLVMALTYNMIDEGYHVRMAPEGSEHRLFWHALGGPGPYTNQKEPINDEGRRLPCSLFRCSASEGYFKVTELPQDFSQSDLDVNSVMLLDSMVELYVWVGPGSSDVVRKLAVKAATAYMEDQTDGRSRDVIEVVQANSEPLRFRRCFHGWWPDSKTQTRPDSKHRLGPS
eukprot:comp62153_c0_seq1/m.47910 comp62153_c0_seq1/g.47910  ORF comp62153_c0_seq1/g.47910 comp62153_c0_seq1/m.47910 type:complete len:1269 (-) comp62153_c0_seq1:480-4286(-)